MVSVVSMVISVLSVVEGVDHRVAPPGPGRYPGSPGSSPDGLREEFDVCLGALALARRRLALGRAEMEEAEHPLAGRKSDGVAPARGTQDGGRAPVRGEPALGRR